MNGPPTPWWKGARGEWWVIGQAALIAALAFARRSPTWTGPAEGWSRVLGALLIVAGVGLAIRAGFELGPNLSPFPRPGRDASLTRTGLYARVRHPIYGGVILTGFGWALWRSSGLHLLLAVVLAVYMNAKAAHEEVHLLRRFPDYDVYRKSTRRMIPWVC
jgi:protein-S-isoprenylcysteine O-methyltransferase Ste14